ncbi:MAG: sugar transferase [Leptolyngbyaceae cyanobacterium bins.349]|nr:sugar transferase [Leptolyngbyaceae cyanobacterium bins.349]
MLSFPLILPNHAALELVQIPDPTYTLVWRQRMLMVRSQPASTINPLTALKRQDWLIDCLQRSPIKLVKLDPNLDEMQLKVWADACHQAQKTAYLSLRSIQTLPQKKYSFCWQIKRVLDWALAALLLMLLSPVLLSLMLLIRLTSPGPIFFYQWRVGERGKLFQIIKFRTMIMGAERLHHQVMINQPGLHKLEHDPRITPLGKLMRKFSLDELPQLLNVLRGEMSLVGPRPWALYDAVRISPDLQHRLNALPGMTGAWQVQARSHLRDLNLVNQHDLKYLSNWSIWCDLKFLVLTIPKVLSGFGAY